MSGGVDFKKSTNIGSIVLALSGYVVLFAGKLITYFFTKITVLYAEALHSLANVIIAVFLLIALVLSRKPADKNYRFGYGRAQNVASLIAATIGIIFIMKVAPIVDGITSFIVAIVIALSAALLWWDNAKSLMGYSPKENFYKKIEDIVKSNSNTF